MRVGAGSAVTVPWKLGGDVPMTQPEPPAGAGAHRAVTARGCPRGRSARAAGPRRARGRGPGGDSEAAAEAARDARASRVSGVVARGDREYSRQLGRRGEGELFSCARKSQTD